MSQRAQPVPTAWEAPIYPLIIGTAFALLGPYTPQAAIVLQLFQILLSLLICYTLFVLGKQVFHERVGLLASFIFAFYPAALHFSVQKIGYITLFVLLSLLLLQQIIKVSTTPSMTTSVSIGVLIGVTSLVNPVIFAFWPFAVLWLCWTGQTSWQRRLTHAAAIVFCLAVTITPWLVRNYLVFDRFVFIKPNFTREMVLGNYGADALSQSESQMSHEADDAAMSAFYRQKALRLVLKEPARIIRKTVDRAVKYWTRIKTTSLSEKLAGAGYYLILLLGLAGIWAYRQDQHAQLLVIFLLTMPLPFYLTWVVMFRYRFPIELVLILFASYAVVSWLSLSLDPKRRRTIQST